MTIKLISMKNSNNIRSEILSFLNDSTAQFWAVMTSGYSPETGQEINGAPYGFETEKIVQIFERNPLTLPVFAFRDRPFFPGQDDVFGMASIGIGREHSKNIILNSLTSEVGSGKDALLLFLSQRNAEVESPSENDLFDLGAVVYLWPYLNKRKEMKICYRTLCRARVQKWVNATPWINAEVELLPTPLGNREEIIDLIKREKEFIDTSLNSKGFDISIFLENPSDHLLRSLSWRLASVLDLPIDENMVVFSAPTVFAQIEKQIQCLRACK